MQEEQPTIYQAILNCQISTEIIVDKWIESYKCDKKQALIDLLQFLVESSGCNGKVSEVYDDYTALIRNLTTEFKEDVSDYPMCRQGVKWKKFRSGFCDLISQHIKRCQNSIIYDGYILTHLTTFLAGLSDSQVRAFRHTATLAAMKLVTVLIEVLLSVSSKHSISRRQYIYETKKSPERRAVAKIEHLSSLIKEEEENIDTLNEIILFLFKAVFVNRYRDIVAAIREICIYEMGFWMKLAPEKFLDDLHLKYIAWSLNDKIGGVRIKAIEVLKPLYETGKYKDSLELFTLKFKDRMVSMTRDVDSNVAVEAIKLIYAVYDIFETAFNHDDVEEIFKLIYCSVSDIAQTAGVFLTKNVENKVLNSIGSEQDVRQSYLNSLFIKYLMQFHSDCGLHKHASYLVDSLIESSKAMKDWKSMTDLLLGNINMLEPLTLDDEKLLIEIILCSVRQAYTGKAPVGRQVKKVQTLKMMKQAKDDAQKIGTCFIPAMPRLFEKYRADSEVLSCLLEIPQYFDLSILSFYPSFIEHMESLLSEFPNIVNVCHDSDILGKCFKTLEILCNESYRISSKAQTCKNMIIDDIVRKYKLFLSEWSQIVDELDDDLKFSLTDSLLKISVVYSVFDLGNWDLWEDLFNFLNEVTNARIKIPEEGVKDCIVACYYSLLWDLRQYEEKLETSTECRMDPKLKLRFFPFIDLLKMFITHSISKICSDESYIIFCDLLVVMNNCSKTSRLPSITQGNTQKVLQAFVERRVFYKPEDSEFEAEIEDLYKRRVMLSSYCKLYIYGILPVYFISHLLKHYVEYFCDFGDILNATILETKNIDNVDCARAIISALMMMFEESIVEIAIKNNTSLLSNIKELAKQLSLFVIGNSQKEMLSAYTLHREAISFALRNSNVNNEGNFVILDNILFFEILIEFSYKLSASNKLRILKFLNSKFNFEAVNDSNHLKPLFLYKSSLTTKKKK